MKNMDVNFIIKCVLERKVFWSYHSNLRLDERGLTREITLASMEKCEIIEEYKDDYPLPSCLCLGHDKKNNPLHCVIGIDKDNDNIRIITAYYPDPSLWENEFRKRRKQI